MLTPCTTLRPAAARQARATAAVRPVHLAAPCARPCKPLPAVVVRVQTGDDSEAMGRDNFAQEENVFTAKDLQTGNIEGSSGQPEGEWQETKTKTQDIGQGLMEPDAAKQMKDSQQMGTELGQVAEERSTPVNGGADTGSQAQEMSQGSPNSEQGGRFDEEPVAGDHPYDPRPRERGHGVPPHKDSSNTGPGPSSGQESTPSASKPAPQSSETSETTARDEFKQDRM